MGIRGVRVQRLLPTRLNALLDFLLEGIKICSIAIESIIIEGLTRISMI